MSLHVSTSEVERKNEWGVACNLPLAPCSWCASWPPGPWKPPGLAGQLSVLQMRRLLWPEPGHLLQGHPGIHRAAQPSSLPLCGATFRSASWVTYTGAFTLWVE